MKKFFILALVALAACTTTETGKTAGGHNPAAATEKLVGSCPNGVKGVIDNQNGGKIYYTSSHPLYQYIKLQPKIGERTFCTVEEANRAGFTKPAPEHFEDSTYHLIQCLKSEGSAGTCHTYVSGIYQSLKIYDKVCGPSSLSPDEELSAIESYAAHPASNMEIGKFYGASGAFMRKYPCHR